MEMNRLERGPQPTHGGLNDRILLRLKRDRRQLPDRRGGRSGGRRSSDDRPEVREPAGREAPGTDEPWLPSREAIRSRHQSPDQN
jgi:hypothetical protein